MSVNRRRPHIFVLPEDDANRQLANGFLLDLFIDSRRLQVLRPAGAWTHVRDDCVKNHTDGMRRYEFRFMVLLIDFDGDVDRTREIMQEVVPQELVDRVFILGVRTEPEELKRDMSLAYEAIGLALSGECRCESYSMWEHDLLRHNEHELKRLRGAVSNWLFREQIA